MIRIVHTTWPFDSNGSSFNFFSMIGVGEVGRLLFATIGSWSGGIGSVGSWVFIMRTIVVMKMVMMMTRVVVTMIGSWSGGIGSVGN